MPEEIYKTKSVENFEAAILLSSRKPDFNNALIHNFYYSCYQYSKFIIISAGIGENELNDHDKSSHNVLITLVFNEIANRDERIKALDFRKNMKELKLLRRHADYDDISINNDQIYKAKLITEKITKLLNQIFSI